MVLSRRSVLSAGAASLAALPLGFPAIAQAKPLKIGVLAARTGPLGTIGECALRATEWATERINKSGGIAGRKIELVIEEETSPKDTVDRFKKLVIQNEVDCIQGIISTGVMISAGVAAEEMETILLSWDGTTQNGVDETMPNAKWAFKSTDNEVEVLIASLLAIKSIGKNFKNIAGINNDFSYGRNSWAAFQALLKKNQVSFQPVGEQWIKIGALDLTSNVNALKANAPDVIFCSLLFAESPVFMKQAHAAGLFERSKLIFPMGGFQQTQFKKAFTPEGALLGVNTLWFDNPQASPLQKEFVSYYIDRFKDYPSSAADRAYFAMELYKGGVEKAYKQKGSWPTKAEVARSIEGLEVMSLGGPGMMKPNHTPEQTFYIGTMSHDNPYDFVTLKNVRSFQSNQFQKGQGQDFWKWMESASFDI